jgi:nitroimidazol reductase NimA-like FMN-containing flavoprotein (pyridoxamine 5'-phosphate oxidase superfamily)
MLGSLTQEQIDQVLLNNITGRIGCYDGTRSYIVPISYVYNEKYIIAHSREGMKINIMRKYPEVCFEVDEMKDMSNWRSVIAWGRYEELNDNRERYYAMKTLVSRLMHFTISETARLPEMETYNGVNINKPEILRPVVYRIRLEEKTGRFETNK